MLLNIQQSPVQRDVRIARCRLLITIRFGAQFRVQSSELRFQSSDSSKLFQCANWGYYRKVRAMRGHVMRGLAVLLSELLMMTADLYISQLYTYYMGEYFCLLRSVPKIDFFAKLQILQSNIAICLIVPYGSNSIHPQYGNPISDF